MQPPIRHKKQIISITGLRYFVDEQKAALGDPLVPYATRVENGEQKILASRRWTFKQAHWLNHIGRALKNQPVGDPALLSDPLFAPQGGFDVINQTFDSGLSDVLKGLNAAI